MFHLAVSQQLSSPIHEQENKNKAPHLLRFCYVFYHETGPLDIFSKTTRSSPMNQGRTDLNPKSESCLIQQAQLDSQEALNLKILGTGKSNHRYGKGQSKLSMEAE